MKAPTRRQVLKTAAASSLSLFGQNTARPNIVYIMADDLGYADLSCYGRRDFTTPNIDRLAAGGTRFLQAYANSAVCSATRTALITGRYQYRLPLGLEEPLGLGGRRNIGLPPSHPTLPSLLKKVGYATMLVGKWHMGHLPDYGPLQSGYDHFWGFRGPYLDYFTHRNVPTNPASEDLWDDDRPIAESGYLTKLLGERASNVIENHVRARQPFFLSLHFNAPHWPWEGPEDEAEAQRLRNMAHYDGGSQKIYARMVTEMDTAVGRVLRTLETTGAAANTIVIFTSDNGGERFSDTWPFTGRKTELLEGGLRIPSIIRWPGKIPAKSTTEQTSMSMDWLPTLLAAGGGTTDIAYPPDGVNLLLQLTRGAAPVSRKLFWRYKSRAQRAMRDGDMKWLRIGANAFLFNVVDDPMERANLKDRQPEVFARLVREYDAWNGTMLPEEPQSSSATFTPSQLADHFGTP